MPNNLMMKSSSSYNLSNSTEITDAFENYLSKK